MTPEEEKSLEYLEYEKKDGEITITRLTMAWFKERPSEIWIPSEIEGVPVTAIGEMAMVLGRKSLKEVFLPASLKTIGDDAFRGCRSLRTLALPDGLESIGTYAFSSCDSLDSIIFPDHLRTIGDRAFSGCESLMAVTLPAGLVSLGRLAFAHCKSLMTAALPDGLTELSFGLFEDCPSLWSVTLPSNLTSIKNNAFSGCSSLMSLEFPSTLTSIGPSAFCGCSSLTPVVFPEGLTSIGSDAFSGCSSLTSLKLPANLGEMRGNPFLACSHLTDFEISSENPLYKIEDGILFSRDGKRLIAYPAGKSDESYRVPDGVTTIGPNAFGGCLPLKTLELPDSVGELERGSLAACDFLESVLVSSEHPYFKNVDGVLFSRDGQRLILYPSKKENSVYQVPDGVLTIGEYAFCNNKSLKTLTFPAGLKMIERRAFLRCSDLSAITLPDSLQTIQPRAFEDCCPALTLYGKKDSAAHQYARKSQSQGIMSKYIKTEVKFKVDSSADFRPKENLE